MISKNYEDCGAELTEYDIAWNYKKCWNCRDLARRRVFDELDSF